MPITFQILNNTKRIDPQVPDAQKPRDHYRILVAFGEKIEWNFFEEQIK
jgi:hypothetical protein